MEGATASQFQQSFINNDFLPPIIPDNDANANANTNDPTSTASPSIYQSLTTPDQITALISNFSTSYNVVSISIILPILSTSSLYSSSISPTTSSIVASSLIAGMIIGQLVGGALGDLIGRRNGMMLVMFLQVVGCAGSAVFVREGLFGDGFSVFQQLAIWRFFVGIGCGGVYPLAALLSSEALQSQSQSQSQSSDVAGAGGAAGDDAVLGQQEQEQLQEGTKRQVRKLKMLAATFSTQGIGFVTVPIVALSLLLMCGKGRLDLVWRLMLVFGSLPGILLMYLRWKAMNAHANNANNANNANMNLNAPYDNMNADANSNASTTNESDNVGTCSGRNEQLEEQEQRGQQRNESRVMEVEMNRDAEAGAGVVDDSANAEEMHRKPSLWSAIKSEDQLFMKLVGTAGTWFLFDIVFYGNTLFQPVVVKTAFGYADTDDDINDADDEFANLVDNIRISMILSIIALPGYFVSVALIGTRLCFKYIQTPRYIQIQGFAFMAILYFLISELWDFLTADHHWLLVFLYGSTFFFSNYGPNTTTFMLPSITFSPECRSTLNGICAASGKAGALIGSMMFAPISDKYGDAAVMCACACTSVFAGIITILCTKPPRTVGN